MNSTSSKAHILVVDDDAKNRIALKALLEGANQDVVLADSGEEALRCVLKQDFAVILLDARMPGIDGFETARLIRERERSRHTPIIFLTGAFEDVRSIFRGYEAGAVDYIAKPPVPEVLQSKIAVFVQLFDKNAILIQEIAERKVIEEQLRTSAASLRALTARLQSVREEEWTRISREIHDELGQALTGLKMDLSWVAARLPTDLATLALKFDSMSATIDKTIQSVRKIASWLRPEILEQMGLAAAIDWQAKEFRKRTGIRCSISMPPEQALLDRERSIAMFRILQESLTNIARHAQATRVEVTLRNKANLLELIVQDNGTGIDESAVSSPTSLGLLGMAERARLLGGTFDVGGGRNRGTKVRVSIPLGMD